jgi:polyphosphate kinase 2 (PPK2 family)
VPVSAPTAEERSYPYLWRFWRDVPARGHIAIFDRSWYGRVLVERVRGFAAPADWRRAYDEICEFERELLEHGLIVAKFWLQVSKAEQLRRFKARD